FLRSGRTQTEADRLRGTPAPRRRTRLLSEKAVHPHRRARQAERLGPARHLRWLLVAQKAAPPLLPRGGNAPIRTHRKAPFVYRLGRHPFTVQRGVRLP